MLKSISCDKFIAYGIIREPITFNMGLNCVLGDDNASNSIGKSTLLMIIDFCFGGNDYISKEADTIDHVKAHTIKFEFVFDGVSKYFKRSTNNDKFVEVCDSNYETKSIITLDNFKLGLLKYYGLDGVDISFRDWISPFFRIYNRKTHNELRPINAHVRETDNDGIVCLLKMFDQYASIESLNEDFLTKKDLKHEYDNLKRFKIAPIAIDENEYNQMKQDLIVFEKELVQLDIDNKTNSNDSSVIEMETKKALKKEKAKLRKQKIALEERLNNINIDSNYDEVAFAKQFKALTEFFPNVNLKGITELERFHKTVVGFIKEDINENNENLHSMILMLDEQIALIDEKLLSYKEVPNVSDDYIKRRHELVDIIKELKTAIDNYEKRLQANTDFNESKETLNKAVASKTSYVQNYLNTHMASYNNLIRQKEKKYAPVFEFNNLASYAFYTPNDTGTGARFKGVCMLDLAILDGTKLPAICHDSIMFTNIEDETARDLFKIYATKTEKQIFVAVEKPSRYDEILPDGTTFNIAKKHMVIQLFEDEGSLFGKQWNKEKV